MPALRAVSSSLVAARGPTLAAVDLKTARGLKVALNEQLERVRLAPTPLDKQPKYDGEKQVWRAPDGRALFAVTLQTPPKGSFDMPSTSALVDPRTNQYFVLRQGGIAGIPFFNGPLGLPAKSQFKHPPYSLADLKELAAAANAKPPPHRLTPQLLEAHFSPGLGLRPPPGVYAGPSVTLRLAFDRPNVEVRSRATLDEKKRTLTVTLDASTDVGSSRVQADAFPQDVRLHVPRPAAADKPYKLLVKDVKGKLLSQSTFKNVLPR